MTGTAMHPPQSAPNPGQGAHPERGSARRITHLLGKRVAAARFVCFLMLFGAIAAASWRLTASLFSILISFDLAALLFIASLAPLLRKHSAEVMRSHVHPNDADRTMLLIITVAVMIVILTTVAGVLSDRKLLQADTLLVVTTLGLSWLFSNSVYALHYAHLYYHRDAHGEDSRGLSFPATDAPDYWDFIYFAFTIGMTFQTSDVQINTRQMRVVVTCHALAAFAFNIGVLAFAINVLGSVRG
jgi:uncharacterized membrane protein